jgi:hypothetical protein
MILTRLRSRQSFCKVKKQMDDQTKRLKQSGYTPIQEAVPPIGHSVMVVTPHFRCAGFLDDSMNWRHARDQALIENVIAWGTLHPKNE